MTGVINLLSRLRDRGVEVWVEGDQLRYRMKAGGLKAEELEQLRENKQAILALFAKVAARETPELPPIATQSRDAPLTLSFAQERLWFLSRMEGVSEAYHMPVALRLKGKLSEAALIRALNRLVERHETLRTGFGTVAGRGLQRIAPPESGFALKRHDLSAESDAEQRLSSLMVDEIQTPFDLRSGPPARGRLICMGVNDRVLLLTLHHISSDAWSLGVLASELRALYAAFALGLVDPLEPLQIQYADYAAWQRQWHSGEALASQRAYWQESLRGAPGLLELPTDRKRPAQQEFAGGFVPLELDETLTEALKGLSQKCGTTLFMTLLAAWSVVLSRLSGQKDLVIGTPTANRTPEVEGLIGFFVNTLALRMDLSGRPTAEDLLLRVREVALGAQENQELPFETVVELVKPIRSVAHTPLFQVMFAWQNNEQHTFELEGLSVAEMQPPVRAAQFDLTLELEERGGRIVGGLNYATALFDLKTIQRHVGYLQRACEQLAADPQQAVEDLELWSTSERHFLLGQNAISVSLPESLCIHELFESQVAASPGAIAITFGDRALSYAELNSRANRLARHLRTLGIGPDQRVAICTERSSEMIVGVLAILKAGGAYVPLDPAYPSERLAFMLEDSSPAAVLVQRELIGRVSGVECSLVSLGQEFLQPSDNLAVSEVGPSNLAYVIYTSGSTGRPKGVMIEHRNVTRLFSATRHWFQFGPRDVWTLFHSFAFDFSVWELWGALLHGGRLVIIPYETSRSPADFFELLCREEVTVLNQTPSAFRQLMVEEACGRQPHSLRLVVFGGEALDVGGLAPWFDRHPADRPRLINMYGITETTVHVTYRPIDTADLRRNALGSPIGLAIPDLRTYVLDEHRRLVPIGVSGELYIAGAGLARGYLNQPELTAERFIQDPFNIDSASRLYKTGDLGRWRADGSLEYLGRNDHQVKIRGFRIELGEIEEQLARHPRVLQAVVIAREDVPGEKSLVAYLVPKDVPDERGAPGAETLRAHLQSVLPDYMVPGAFVTLERFPLTSNGKLDRRALPAPGSAAYARREYEAPGGETEQLLAAIWQSLLSLESVGRNDNFFELGGHSLLMVKMIERLGQMGLSASVRGIYTHPTLAGMARTISAASDSQFVVPPNGIPSDCGFITPGMLPLVPLEQEQIDTIVRSVPGGARNVEDIYPLAPLQEGILFHHLLDEHEADTYVLPTLLSIASRARLNELVGALQAVIDRHDVLRTAVLWDRLPRPVQVVYRRAALPVNEVRLDRQRDPELQAREWLASERQRLDLRQAPLMRLQVAADPRGNQWYALLQFHHITCDHETTDAIIAEVVALLDGCGHPPSPSLPYRNHVAQAIARVASHDAEAFFCRKLGDIEEPTAPFGLLDVHRTGGRIDEAHVALDSALAGRVRQQARRLGVSAATVFHAAWGLVVARTSGREEAVFGSVLLGRLQGNSGGQQALGLFINTLPLRLRLQDVSAKELVEQTQSELVELLNYEQASLAVAQRCSGISGSAPLFSTLLNYRHSALGAATDWSDAQGIRTLAFQERTNYPITLSVDDLTSGFRLTAQTDQRIRPERITAYLRAAIESLVDALERAPRTLALSLSILPDSERHLLVKDFNATGLDIPREKLIHEMFEEQAERSPHAIAVIHDESRLTYAELNAKANRLAHYLRGKGIRPDTLVGICVERTPDMVVGLLGILKAGGAYVPLDPSYPAERLLHILEDAAPAVVLTHRRLRQRLPPAMANVVALDDEAGPLARQPGENLENLNFGLRSHHLAYLIYTSGSTGRPKGVAIEHRNAVNLICWARATSDPEIFNQTLHCTSLNFDLSVYECFVPLSVGGSIRVVRDALALKRSMSGVTLVNTVPSAIKEIVDAGDLPETTRVVNLAGEALGRPVVEGIFAHSAVQAVRNLYGPSETTTYSSWISMSRDSGFVGSIGRPIANTQIYILDTSGQLVPIGVVGEIYIGGLGVARGYWNRPELTTARFPLDPFSSDPQARFYKTGDLGCWRPDGTIDYLGRNDHQVKIRGFRIELGEIEAQLMRRQGVRAAVVVAREDVPGQKRLVAYVTQQESSGHSLDALRADLRAVLPEYMIPGAIVALESLPLTPSGKVDRNSLPAPELGVYASRDYEPPEGEVESILSGMWKELLHVERVGRRDEFFELGGHSLLAMQVLVRIRGVFSIEMPLRTLFEASTVEQLALCVEERRQARLLESIEDGSLELEEVLQRVASIPESEAQELMRELRRGERQ